jgi:2-(3-amino-3-carboxypropyl)histidine synthase
VLTNCEAVVFVADGRFHLESVMIQNPSLHDSFYRYDPYNKVLSHEGYDTEKMRHIRWCALLLPSPPLTALTCALREAITRARRAVSFGLVLGTLGRQGNQSIFNRMRRLLREWDNRERHSSGGNRKAVLFLMAELNPQKLACIKGIDCWVQVSCPRLSIDWGEEFKQVRSTPP